ncbi:hypothetical protein Ntsu_08230 [Nocardia sp. IFM 10818]
MAVGAMAEMDAPMADGIPHAARTTQPIPNAPAAIPTSLREFAAMRFPFIGR